MERGSQGFLSEEARPAFTVHSEEVDGDRDESHLLALLPHTTLTLMEHHRFQVTTSPVHALDGAAVDRFQKSVSSPASVLLNSFVAVREHVKGLRGNIHDCEVVKHRGLKFSFSDWLTNLLNSRR